MRPAPTPSEGFVQQGDLYVPDDYEPSEKFMQQALNAAWAMPAGGDHRIGAALTYLGGDDEVVIAKQTNNIHRSDDPTKHAEYLAIASAAIKLGDREALKDCVLYTPIEPCAFCAGAVWAARLWGVVCGATVEDVEEYRSLHPTTKFRINTVRAVDILGGSKDPDPPHFLYIGFMRAACKELFASFDPLAGLHEDSKF